LAAALGTTLGAAEAPAASPSGSCDREDAAAIAMTTGTEAEGHTKAPRCIKGHMPCRGCFGPIRKGANPMVDMMGAISSIGLNPQQVPDRRAMLNRGERPDRHHVLRVDRQHDHLRLILLDLLSNLEGTF
jgi:F420-non-reducing hydrogenase small subunit